MLKVYNKQALEYKDEKKNYVVLCFSCDSHDSIAVS